MFTIEIELLAGRYAATAHNDRRKAEWPPHPARFYSALVAAYHDNDELADDERQALLWLEGQAPPELSVDLKAAERHVLDLFVPVNDSTIAGDPERGLRDARAELAGIQGDDKAASSGRKKAEKVVEKEAAKVGAAVARLHELPSEPPEALVKLAATIMPDRRTRQLRTFPVAVPEQATFAFIWRDAEGNHVREALDRLCSRVTRLGHSSSLVRCRVVDTAPESTLVPVETGEVVLRTVGEGQLGRLEEAFSRHQAVESRVLPAKPQAYGPPSRRKDLLAESVFSSDWILFERAEGRPMSSKTTALTRALRGAIIEQHGSESLPGALSGHEVDRSAVTYPHVAFVALPFVGRPHADGSIKGVALVLPRSLDPVHREQLLKLVAGWESDRSELDERSGRRLLTLANESVSAKVVREPIASQWSTRPSTWCKPSTRFVTATPIALDRNPGDLRSNRGGRAARAAAEAQQIIARACEFIGLPRPVSIEVSFAPMLDGAQSMYAFLPWPPQQERHPRVRVHADILFDKPVRGPVILGAGRYFGLGLCLPMDEETT